MTLQEQRLIDKVDQISTKIDIDRDQIENLESEILDGEKKLLHLEQEWLKTHPCSCALFGIAGCEHVD